MATAVKSVTFLPASASPGFSSSAKLSSSSISSITARWKVPGFKGLKFRPSSTFGPVNHAEQTKDHPAAFEDYESVSAKRNKLKGELARSNNEIERLRAVIGSAWKDLGTVLNCLKKIDQELRAEPEPEHPTVNIKPEPEEHPNKRPRYTREGFLNG